jgi:hypothetical protein
MLLDFKADVNTADEVRVCLISQLADWTIQHFRLPSSIYSAGLVVGLLGLDPATPLAEWMDASALRIVRRSGGCAASCGCQGRIGCEEQGLALCLARDLVQQRLRLW